VVQAASDVLDHDINPDDGIEQFMRRHYPRASNQFIAAVKREAVELRDLKRLHALFEYIHDNTPAWPDDKKIHNELAVDIEEDAARELLRRTRESDRAEDWELWKERRKWSRESVNEVAREAAQLLIEQAAWRKHDDETKASYELPGLASTQEDQQ